MIEVSHKLNNSIVSPLLKHKGTELLQPCFGKYNQLLSEYGFKNLPLKKIFSSEYIICDWVMGAAMVIPTVVLEKCGLFDTEYYPATVEESAYCTRLKHGFDCVVVCSTSADHIGGTSMGSKRNYFTRLMGNRFLFIIKESPLYAIIPSILTLMLRIFLFKLTPNRY